MIEANLGGGKSKLVSIEYLDEEKDVYDFHIPEGHEYLANDIAVHNSAVANQLGINMSKRGTDVALVTLEMTDEQAMHRELGVLSGVAVNDIARGKLTKQERRLIKRKYAEFVNELKEKGTRYSFFAPDEDVSIEETLFMLKPYGYKVVIIDYISLLKGADGDEQWKQLGKIARFAKVFAKNNNMVVILLAQLGAEGIIRYSGALKEHANNVWSWNAPKEHSDVSIYDIEQQKARNQKRFPFQLMSINAPMQITKVDESLLSSLNDEEPQSKSGKKASKSGKKVDADKYLAEIDGEDEDGDDEEDD